MDLDNILIGGLLLALTGCQDAGETREESAQSSVQSERFANASQPSSTESSEVGMFRWSSGMQMGTFWAAVGNNSGDYLRFYSDDGNAWEPSIELASANGLAPDGAINIVVGNNAEVFSYELVDGQPEILFFGMDGERSKMRLVELLKSTSGPVCAEFLEANRRTCFSTSGVDNALS